jgi:hypothetical protein
MWPKTRQSPEPVTQGFFVRLRDEGSVPSQAIAAEVRRISAKYRFFHWHLSFPEVFRMRREGDVVEDLLNGWSGGFDVVVGNPPWERVEVQEEEFFALNAPEIASAKNAAARRKLILALPETNPALAQAYADARRAAETESAFLRLSGRYPLGGVGKVNTYAVFADLARQLLSPFGMAGLILPNGLVAGFTYRDFLRHLLSSKTLSSFYGFENEDKIFPEVHNETKFGILTMVGVGRTVQTPEFTAHIRQPDEVHDTLRRYSLTADQIRAINPNTLNLPTFRWAADALVTAAIHSAAPVLVRRSDNGSVENPWAVRFRQLFNMATDSGLFLDHEGVAPLISARHGARAILADGRTIFPLYEGKMLWHFDHRYGTFEGQTAKQANKGVLPHVADSWHDQPSYRIQPRYWVSSEETLQALGDDSKREWFFSWRDVGPTERTFVGALVPATAAGDQTPLMTLPQSPEAAAALVAILSSLVVDYDARQKSSRMKLFVVEQLAVLAPKQVAVRCDWLGHTLQTWLANRTLELSYTNEELASFARQLGHEHPPFRWIPERRALLQAETDAAVLHLYSLDRDQAEWLIDSFTVLRKYEEADYGEFRTKRLVLERFDAMTRAKEGEGCYVSPLDPPAADPRLAHAATY